MILPTAGDNFGTGRVRIQLPGPDAVGGHSVVGLDVGGIYKIGGPFSLLFSGGPVHEHHGPTGWRGYAALGLSF